MSPRDQEILDSIIELVIACKLEQANKLFSELLSKIAKHSFRSVILGCTELPIALKSYQNKKLQIIDSNYILAESLVDEYYRKLKLTKWYTNGDD